MYIPHQILDEKLWFCESDRYLK